MQNNELYMLMHITYGISFVYFLYIVVPVDLFFSAVLFNFNSLLNTHKHTHTHIHKIREFTDFFFFLAFENTTCKHNFI